MILRKSCPVRGLKIKMAPLIGFVVKLPSNVWNENVDANVKQCV